MVSPSVTDRRTVLKCMAWAGTGALWIVSGGVPRSSALGDTAGLPAAKDASLTFVQISDTHIGFSKEANPDVAGTLRLAIDRINALDPQPAFVLHTGDVTHLSKPAEFATAQDMLSALRAPVHVIPGEHDVIGDDNGAALNARDSSIGVDPHPAPQTHVDRQPAVAERRASYIVTAASDRQRQSVLARSSRRRLRPTSRLPGR